MSLAQCKPVIFIGTANRAAAKVFYGETLGLTQLSEDDFAVVYDLNGTMMRLSDIGGHTPSPHTILGWLVDDIATTMSVLRDRGVTFQIYEGFGQREDGIWQAPGGGPQIAWFLDPDGNNLSLTQF
ncbi:VOC family protein [Parerythrobacter aurantius]|uniref:VOC family protein n=1 Tax=Parerythrobacter aurantius TaxID=3127706 RepID=UPI003247201D